MPPEPPPATPATPATPLKRRRWVKWLKRVVLGIVVLLLLIVGWEYLQWQLTWRAGNARLQPLIAELDATDPDWRAAGLCATRNARLAPPEANTAEQALAAAKLLPQPFDKRLQAVAWWRWRPVGEMPSSEESRSLTECLRQSGSAVAEARNLRRLPNSGVAVVFADPIWARTQLPHAHVLHDLGLALGAEARHQAVENHGDDAIRAVRTQLAVAASIGDEPTVAGQSVRVATSFQAVFTATDVLGLCQPTEPALAELQLAFGDEAEQPRATHAIKGDRAGVFRAMQGVDRSELAFADLFSLRKIDGPQPEGTSWGERFDARHHFKNVPLQTAKAMEYHNQLLAAASLPHGPNRRSELRSIERAMAIHLTGYMSGHGTKILSLLLANLVPLIDTETNSTALLRCAATAIACERFRLKTGRFPKSLAELPPTLLPTIPDDPYTGNPVRLSVTGTGLVVSASSSGGIDPGIKFRERSQEEEPGREIGFTLLDPKHRRRPPATKPADE